MSAATKLRQTSVEEYLAHELDAEAKHEYLGGFVYAMAGGSNAHNRIAGNIFGQLYGKLQGRPCQPCNSDTKVRVYLPTHVRFYYPDVSVVCESNPPADSFQDHPVILVEVLSEKTRRTDQGEKRDAYLTIGSLKGYLLVEQDCAAVTHYRRTDEGFVCESYADLSATMRLEGIGVELSLAEIYEGVAFGSEPADDRS